MLGSKKISTYLVNTAAKSDSEVASRKEIYIYCLDFLVEQLIFLVSLLFIGCFLHDIPFCLLFFAVFLTYRSTGGGFHANSVWLCTLLSYTTFFSVWALIQSPFALWKGPLYPLHLLSYAVIVSLFSLLPVAGHKNKKIMEAFTMSTLTEISQAIQTGKMKLIKELVPKAIEEGCSAQSILSEGLLHGMNIVGDLENLQSEVENYV